MTTLDKRADGVLMHISSLPGNFGIGTFGKNAYEFVDFLKESAQTYWQILPIGPTSYGDSPYQSFSTFAGNPYFIDLEKLVEQGFLKQSDYENIDWGQNSSQVDYGKLYVNRKIVFKKVFENFQKNIPADFDLFCKENAFWLDDYSLFMAIKDAHNGVSFDNWKDNLRRRDKTALKKWSKDCGENIFYYKMLQYLFFNQWFALKNYANDNGIKIIGDIPIYVAADSADVWSNPEQFSLGSDFKPVEVAGCPPDGFSADGQLWGNPVYNWDYMKKDGYSWWKKRLEMSLKIYDVLRIDHFRGFEAYYCIKYGESTAKNGKWRKGPGADLFNEIKKTYGELPIIAEDLGFLTEEVHQMLEEVGFPGMKVLQFAFDSREASDYLPLSYTKNSVVYTGTHDNETIKGWMKTCPPKDLEYAKEYLRSSDETLPQDMMIAAISSVSNTCILCMQDLIGLGSEARMNAPSSVGTNWKWRAKREQITSEISKFLRYYTKLYQR